MARFQINVGPQALTGVDNVFKSGDLAAIPAMTVDVDVSGIDVIRKNLAHVGNTLIRQAVLECRRLSMYLLDESQKIVPYKEGFLHDSGKVNEDESDALTGFTVSYDAVNIQYAWLMHEVPMNHPTRGPHPEAKRDHFLSDPADELAGEFPDIMRTKLRQAVTRAAAGFAGKGSVAAVVDDDIMTPEEALAEARAALGLD